MFQWSCAAIGCNIVAIWDCSLGTVSFLIPPFPHLFLGEESPPQGQILDWDGTLSPSFSLLLSVSQSGEKDSRCQSETALSTEKCFSVSSLRYHQRCDWKKCVKHDHYMCAVHTSVDLHMSWSAQSIITHFGCQWLLGLIGCYVSVFTVPQLVVQLVPSGIAAWAQ